MFGFLVRTLSKARAIKKVNGTFSAHSTVVDTWDELAAIGTSLMTQRTNFRGQFEPGAGR